LKLVERTVSGMGRALGDLSSIRLIPFYFVVGLPITGIVLSTSIVLVRLQFLFRIERLLANVLGVLIPRILALVDSSTRDLKSADRLRCPINEMSKRGECLLRFLGLEG
jgi:hypothetical protein